MDMTAEREGAILEGAIDKWGEAKQVDKMIEEMSELTKELLKLRAYNDTGLARKLGKSFLDMRVSKVLEEIADVQIMLNQMQLIYGDCTEYEIFKLERLASRLGMEDRDGGTD